MFNYLKRMKINSLKKKIAALDKFRMQGQMDSDKMKKEIQYLLQLAKVYQSVRFNKAFPNAYFYELECYRMAASLEDANSVYILGKRLLDQARFWDNLQKDIFANKVADKYAKSNYEEAFVYLEHAEKQGSHLAKRLRGLALINGWGVGADQDQGFKLVVASIEDEKAWDKATEIFKELGLNKPEFFSYLMKKKS